MPRREKTVSTMMVPARRLPNCTPMMVTTGMSALPRACLRTTARSASPFARAVPMYALPRTSRKLERTRRATTAA